MSLTVSLYITLIVVGNSTGVTGTIDAGGGRNTYAQLFTSSSSIDVTGTSLPATFQAYAIGASGADTTLTVTTRSSFEVGVVEAFALASDACPAHELNPGTNVVSGTSRDFETRGCQWRVEYVSSLEGDEYEIELVVQ